APMKGIVRRENFVPAAQVLAAVATRQFDRRLVGLRPAVAKENPVRERVTAELTRQLRLGLDMIEIGGMQQLFRLLLDGANHRGMTVAQPVDCDAGEKRE